MRFTEDEIRFMNTLNNTGRDESNIYFTAKHSGYMRGLDRRYLEVLEAIYKRIVNDKFVLCYHCPHEIMKIVLKLYGELEKDQQAEPEGITEQPKAKNHGRAIRK